MGMQYGRNWRNKTLSFSRLTIHAWNWRNRLCCLITYWSSRCSSCTKWVCFLLNHHYCKMACFSTLIPQLHFLFYLQCPLRLVVEAYVWPHMELSVSCCFCLLSSLPLSSAIVTCSDSELQYITVLWATQWHNLVGLSLKVILIWGPWQCRLQAHLSWMAALQCLTTTILTMLMVTSKD